MTGGQWNVSNNAYGDDLLGWGTTDITRYRSQGRTGGVEGCWTEFDQDMQTSNKDHCDEYGCSVGILWCCGYIHERASATGDRDRRRVSAGLIDCSSLGQGNRMDVQGTGIGRDTE